MGSNGALFANICNSSDGNGKIAEDFFKQLAENSSLHQKLDSVGCIAEDEFRGLAILSRTLFLFTMDIRDERDKAKEDFAQTIQELTHLRNILCSACKKNVPQGGKKNDVPEQDVNIPITNLGVSGNDSYTNQSAKSPAFDRRQLREMKIFKKEYRRLSRSPKKKTSKVSPKKLVMGFQPHGSNSPSHHFGGGEIFAPETQATDIHVISKEPVDGCISIPETMAMEDDPVHHRETYRNTDFFDDSRDVFGDISGVEEDPSEYFTGANKTAISATDEALTYTHISPILGREGSGSKDSPFRVKLRSLNDGFSSSSGSSTSQSVTEVSNSQSNTVTAQVIPNVVNSVQAKYLSDFNASQISSKIVNITISPKCQSEVELQSPSLLNVVPRRMVNSQPVGSQISMNSKSIYKCDSNQVPIALPQPIENPVRFIAKEIPTVSLLSSAESCKNRPNEGLQTSLSIEVITTDKVPNPTLGKFISAQQKSPEPDSDMSTENSNGDLEKQQLHDRPSTPKRGFNVSILNKNLLSSDYSSVMKTVSVPVILPKEGIATDGSSSLATAKPCQPSSRVLGGCSAKGNNRSLSMMEADTAVQTSWKSLSRHQSHTVAVKGSKLYNKIEVNPVAATIKKNYKQTKLTAESFFASKKKGNLDSQ